MKKIVLILIIAVLYTVYYSINIFFFLDYGYTHSKLTFFAEKALLATEGKPPRLENIGFVYPPLAFVPFLLIKNPTVVPALVSAMVSGLLIFLLMREKDSFNIAGFLYVLLLLFNPLYLFLASQRFDVLLFYMLLSFSVWFGIKHLESGYSIYAFASGLSFGLTFFVDFRSIFLLPVFAIGVYSSTKEKTLHYRLAIILVKLTPILFFLLSWMYLNWVFTEDPFHFINSPYSFFRGEDGYTYSTSLVDSIRTTFKFLFYNLPLIAPYVIVLLYLVKYRLFCSIPFVLFYILPILLVYLSAYFGLFIPSFYQTILFLIFAFIFQKYTLKNIKIPLSISAIISFVLSFILPTTSPELNEKSFIRALIYNEKPNKVLLKSEDIKIAYLIKEINCRKTLTDDAYSFEVVFFHGNPNAFVLPYNYEYYTYLSYPYYRVDCILIDKRDVKGPLIARFPKAKEGYLKGYFLVHQGDKYVLYKAFW